MPLNASGQFGVSQYPDSNFFASFPRHCAFPTAHNSPVISARALENGGFFLTAGPRHSK